MAQLLYLGWRRGESKRVNRRLQDLGRGLRLIRDEIHPIFAGRGRQVHATGSDILDGTFRASALSSTSFGLLLFLPLSTLDGWSALRRNNAVELKKRLLQNVDSRLVIRQPLFCVGDFGFNGGFCGFQLRHRMNVRDLSGPDVGRRCIGECITCTSLSKCMAVTLTIHNGANHVVPLTAQSSELVRGFDVRLLSDSSVCMPLPWYWRVLKALLKRRVARRADRHFSGTQAKCLGLTVECLNLRLISCDGRFSRICEARI